MSHFHDYITENKGKNGGIAKTREMAKFQVALFV